MMPSAMGGIRRSARTIIAGSVTALVFAGCIGAYRVPPVSPTAEERPGSLTEDEDAGLVSVAPGFRLNDYPVILVDLFTVSDRELNDDEDRHLPP